jgi:hypothetical protein
MTRAACLQAQVDQLIFIMPQTIQRSEPPGIEEVVFLSRPDAKIEWTGSTDKLPTNILSIQLIRRYRAPPQSPSRNVPTPPTPVVSSEPASSYGRPQRTSGSWL